MIDRITKRNLTIRDGQYIIVDSANRAKIEQILAINGWDGRWSAAINSSGLYSTQNDKSQNVVAWICLLSPINHQMSDITNLQYALDQSD
jgi:hypothetical protein